MSVLTQKSRFCLTKHLDKPVYNLILFLCLSAPECTLKINKNCTTYYPVFRTLTDVLPGKNKVKLL